MMTEVSCLPSSVKGVLISELSKMELDNDMVAFLDELDQPCQVVDKKKVKRKPSKYNIFMGECIRGRKNGEVVSEAMKRCAVEWKNRI